jgi:phosphoglycerate dehydrogenase-like enzyme
VLALLDALAAAEADKARAVAEAKVEAMLEAARDLPTFDDANEIHVHSWLSDRAAALVAEAIRGDQ